MDQDVKRSVSVSNVGVFEVADLLVDVENFRLEPNPDQPSAIKAMLRRQRRKLVTLAEEILDSGGLSAGEFVWLAPDPRPEMAGKYIVCEGNRRVTALKLMNHPSLAEGTSWAKQFRELAERFEKNPITQVRAVLYDSVEAARPDVSRRHTNAQDGAGLEEWGPFAQDRSNKAENKRRTLSMVVLEHLAHGSAEAFAEQLGIEERTTNADRLLSTFSKTYSARFGMKLRGTLPHVDLGPDPELSEGLLLAILKASDVSVDSIKTEEMRSVKLAEIVEAVESSIRETRASHGDDDEVNGSAGGGSASDAGSPGGSGGEAGAAAGSGGTGGSSSTGGGGKRPRPTKDPLDRKTLARTGSSYDLRVKSSRLAALFNECRRINVDEMPNAAAMLLRVFVELSCEAYLVHHNVRPPDGKATWGARHITIEKKAKRILSLLDPKRDNPDLVDAWNGVADGGGFSHSVDEMHRAMHDLTTYLDPREIKVSWERWHPMLVEIHTSID